MTKRKPKDQQEKRGRPTDYKPEFRELVITLGKEGKSLAAMANACGVHRSNFDIWTKKHPEFRDAVLIAQQYSQEKWEELGMSGCNKGHGFNGQTYTFMMRNLFRNEYQDKSTVEHTGDAFKDFLAAARKAGGKGPANPHGGDDD